MKKVSIIGVDLAKNVFQLHGAATDGAVLFRKKLSRLQFQRFISEHPRSYLIQAPPLLAYGLQWNPQHFFTIQSMTPLAHWRR